MIMSCEGTERRCTIHIAGEVDHHSAKRLLGQLDEELASRLPHTLTLDLGGVSFMDSSGIALLMRCRQRMEGMGTLEVVNTPAQPLRMLRAAHIDRYITFK